ncbi:MAG TPA: hypothetical protein VGD56_21815 [Gemmatirosa sp.]
MFTKTACHIATAAVLSWSTSLPATNTLVQSVPDMRVDDFEQLGRTQGGNAQVRYLINIAREFADNRYDPRTAAAIIDCYTVSHDDRPYGNCIYDFKGFIIRFVPPEKSHERSTKEVVGALIAARFGKPSSITSSERPR